jgi:hypothetical protein
MCIRNVNFTNYIENFLIHYNDCKYAPRELHDHGGISSLQNFGVLLYSDMADHQRGFYCTFISVFESECSNTVLKMVII